LSRLSFQKKNFEQTASTAFFFWKFITGNVVPVTEIFLVRGWFARACAVRTRATAERQRGSTRLPDLVQGREKDCSPAFRSVGEMGVFSLRKVCEKVVVARFGFIWQLLSNYRVISFKRFVSSFTIKLYN